MRYSLALCVGLLLVLTAHSVMGQAGLISGKRTLIGGLNYCGLAGGPNTYTCPLDPPALAIPPGMCFTFQATLGNTGASTLTVNALAPIPLTKRVGDTSTPLVTGDIEDGEFVTACTSADGTTLQIPVLRGIPLIAGVDYQTPLVAGTDYLAPANLDTLAELNTLVGDANLVPETRTISTTAPLAGGGTFVVNRTFSCPTCTINANPLTANAPMIGAGGQAAGVGLASGTTTEFATVTGPKPANKQLVYDASGNISASIFEAGTGTGGTWGTITGTLSAQTDLQAALDARQTTANLSTNTALGTSNTLYPSVNAVKVYVDTVDATKQATVTWGAGLQAAGATASTASTEPNFLLDGGATNLTGGVSQQGKIQVLDDGRIQYTDGATTALVWTGHLLPPPLTFSITPGTCTGDANAGKLTINGANQVICAADQGGAGGGGTVTQINTTSPLQGGPITTTGTLSIAFAVADGTTRGAVAFNANDFNCTAGVCSLDYAFITAASSTNKGMLTAADWTTFNSKQAALGFAPVPDTRTINGHDLTANVTVTKTDVGLGNVTDAAQLTRAAGDFSTFTVKATPVGADRILLEDSAAAGAKKYITLSTIPVAGVTVQEIDTTPTITNITTLKVSNGTLTDDGGGVGTLTIGVGGGTGDASTDTGTSVAGQLAMFANTTGKVLGRVLGTGIPVLTAPDSVATLVAAPQGTVVGTTDTQALTNKDIAWRVSSVASATSFPCNVATSDWCIQENSESTGTITIPAPTGTPRDAQQVRYRLVCSNGGQSYSFDSIFRFPGDVPAPLTCPAGSADYWVASWNATESVYDILTVVQGAGTGASLGGHIIQDEGTSEPAQARLNFIGAGVSVANNTGTGATDVTITGLAGQAYGIVQEEGSPLGTQTSTLNFQGAALTASHDAGNNRANIALAQSPSSSTAVVGVGRLLTAGFGMQTLGDLSTDLTVAHEAATAGDQLYVSDSTSDGTWRTLADCVGAGKAMTYATATNLFGCNTISTGTPSNTYITTFTGQISVTVTGATHGLGTADLFVACWDAATPRQYLPVVDVETDADDFDVRIAFNRSQSGRCLLSPGAGSVGTGVTDGDKGNITVSGTGTVWTIDNGVVTYAKVQNVTANRLLGRDTESVGGIEELSVSGGVEFTTTGGIQRSALTGDVTAAAGNNATTIAAQAVSYAKMQNVSAASRLVGRGSAAGAGSPQEITLGANCTMTGTVLNCTGALSTGSQQLNPNSVRFPTSVTPATLDNSETNSRLLFATTDSRCVDWQFLTPPDYTGTPGFQYVYSMATATTGNLAMDIAVMAGVTTADVNTESFDIANACDDATVPGTAGFPKTVTCSLTNADGGLVAGRYLKIRMCRDVANDNAAGDAEVIGALFTYAR